MKKKKHYYIVELEVALKTSKFVFGFINISHIPYSKFEEIFKEQITTEHFLFENSRGYDIDGDLYEKNKLFFDKEIPFIFDFNLFEYCVSFASIEVSAYKKNYYDELPPQFA
ncbi:MAG TPA: hypothetical protein VGG71_03705 [Chitinophagaceae bacterium]